MFDISQDTRYGLLHPFAVSVAYLYACLPLTPRPRRFLPVTFEILHCLLHLSPSAEGALIGSDCSMSPGTNDGDDFRAAGRRHICEAG